MEKARITVLKNGPLKVEGAPELVLGSVALPEQAGPVFLCRCGASAKKPFCDGAHAGQGFRGGTGG
jgi:CDGSH-type Zn-finger protein